VEYRRHAADDATWQPRFLLTDVPREFSYFGATCEYHATAPDSHFTGDPIAVRPTPEGHVSLSPRRLTRVVDGDRQRREIDPQAYPSLLAETFGLRVDGG